MPTMQPPKFEVPEVPPPNYVDVDDYSASAIGGDWSLAFKDAATAAIANGSKYVVWGGDYFCNTRIDLNLYPGITWNGMGTGIMRRGRCQAGPSNPTGDGLGTYSRMLIINGDMDGTYWLNGTWDANGFWTYGFMIGCQAGALVENILVRNMTTIDSTGTAHGDVPPEYGDPSTSAGDDFWHLNFSTFGTTRNLLVENCTHNAPNHQFFASGERENTLVENWSISDNDITGSRSVAISVSAIKTSTQGNGATYRNLQINRNVIRNPWRFCIATGLDSTGEGREVNIDGLEVTDNEITWDDNSYQSSQQASGVLLTLGDSATQSVAGVVIERNTVNVAPVITPLRTGSNVIVGDALVQEMTEPEITVSGNMWNRFLIQAPRLATKYNDLTYPSVPDFARGSFYNRDNSQSHLITGVTDQTTADVTWAGEIRVLSAPDASVYIYDKDDGVEYPMKIWIDPTGFLNFGSKGSAQTELSVPMPFADWVKFALTIEGTTAKIYLNGVLVLTNTWGDATTRGTNATNALLMQATQNASDATRFNGEMRWFRHYSKALNATEVDNLGDGLLAPAAGLEIEFLLYNGQDFAGSTATPGRFTQVSNRETYNWQTQNKPPTQNYYPVMQITKGAYQIRPESPTAATTFPIAYFSGTDSVVSSADLTLNQTFPITLTASFNLDTVTTPGSDNYQNLACIGRQNSDNNYARIGVLHRTTGEKQLFIRTRVNGVGGSEVVISPLLAFETDYRMVAVWNSSTDRRVYLDGALVETFTDSKTLLTTDIADNALSVGARVTDAQYDPIQGNVGDAQYWRDAFTLDDVAYDYANRDRWASSRVGTALSLANLQIAYQLNGSYADSSLGSRTGTPTADLYAAGRMSPENPSRVP